MYITKQASTNPQFLAKHKVMDYSLLLGIYYETGPEQALKVKDNLKRLESNPYRIT